VSDLDPLCEDEVRKTFELNGLSGSFPRGFFGPRGTARALRDAGESFDLVVSNIYAEILTAIARDVAALLRPGGLWIVSGILRGPPEEQFLEATEGIFRRTWSETRIQRGTRLDAEEGLKPLEETWAAYEFERTERPA
jgi:ribosomal protein L11 methylase PrmA